MPEWFCACCGGRLSYGNYCKTCRIETTFSIRPLSEEDAAAREATRQFAEADRIYKMPENERPGPLGLAPEERPGSIDGRQRSRMMVAFKALGIDDRGERLADTVSIIGRPLTSSSELSWSEAEGVVRELEGRMARANLGHASQGSTP
jgi:hypothetical protein